MCYQCNGIEFIWFFIQSCIFEAMSLFIPKIYLKNHRGPKSFISDIRHHLKCLHTMRRSFKSHPTPLKKYEIDSREGMLRIKMDHVNSAFECKLIESLQTGQSKPIYSYMHNLTNVYTISSTINLNNINAVSHNEKATLFNHYFHSVFTNSIFRLPEVNNLPRPEHFINTITITESGVYRALLSLDPTKATSCDKISPKISKHCAPPLYQPLHHLFCQSLSQHYIPREWCTDQFINLGI